MKHHCPKCGHEWEAPSANQTKGGKARWKGTKKKDRSAAASAAALARWKNKKASPGPSNDQAQPRSGENPGVSSGEQT